MSNKVVPLNGFGGSGENLLNFKIVGGTTQPANPIENMIWVNTNQPITDWTFKSYEPQQKQEGLIWIETSNISNIEFNVLKKNNIDVYPLFIKQYINNTWEQKEAKIYQNEWLTWWTGSIYDQGNENINITGGFEHNGNGTCNKGSNYITISYSGTGKSHLHTKNKINFSVFNNLYINVTGLSLPSGNPNSAAGLWIDDDTTEDNGSIESLNFTHTGLHVLDISNITGSYYLTLRAFSYSSSSSLTFNKIWLE